MCMSVHRFFGRGGLFSLFFSFFSFLPWLRFLSIRMKAARTEEATTPKTSAGTRRHPSRLAFAGEALIWVLFFAENFQWFQYSRCHWGNGGNFLHCGTNKGSSYPNKVSKVSHRRRENSFQHTSIVVWLTVEWTADSCWGQDGTNWDQDMINTRRDWGGD